MEQTLSGNTQAKTRRWLPLGITVGAGLVLWVLGLGLDQWPWGTILNWPRVVPLVVLVGGSALLLVCLWVQSRRSRSQTWLIATILVTLLFTGSAAWVGRKVVRWRAGIWLGDFLTLPRTSFDPRKPLDICFCVVDHFEPAGIWQTRESFPVQRRMERLHRWRQLYSQAIEGHVDSDGQSPRQTWFIPVGHSVPEVMTEVARWARKGWGEMEYHLHHPKDFGADEVRSQILLDLHNLRRVGACADGYAFVHGEYALAAGDPAFCRVTKELDVLQETRCYADFTFPNIYTPAQPSQVNSIFYARTTGDPKPHDRGSPARVGHHSSGLLLIQGGMWAGFTIQVFDDSNLSTEQPPDAGRINHWLAANLHVRGRPNWVFIILHTHSATEYAQDMLYLGAMQETWSALEARFKTPQKRLHYMTCREVYNVVKAAEAGQDGNPNNFRDYVIPPPPNCRPVGVDPHSRD